MIPSSVLMLFHSAAQLRADVSSAHASGPRTLFKCNFGSKLNPPSRDAPTVKPLYSSEQA
jgi:hypothetical protein